MEDTIKVKFFCEICQSHQCVEVDKVQSDELNDGDPWGDIVCIECRFIIATYSAEKPGVLVFVPDGDKNGH